MNICCCRLHKVNKLVEIKNELRDLLTNVNKVKNVSYEYLLLLFTLSNKLVEIQNESRELLPNVNKGKEAC